MEKLSKTTEVVYKLVVEAQQPIESDDVVSNLNFNLRTVRYAFKTLYDSALIEQAPNVADLRNYYYRTYPSAFASLN